MSITLSKVSTFNQLISSSPKTYGRRGSVVGVSRSHFKKTNETSLRRGREMHPRPSLDPGYKHQNIQFVFRRTFQSVSSATPVIFFFLFVSFFFQHFCYIFLSPPPPPSPALPSPFTFFFFISAISHLSVHFRPSSNHHYLHRHYRHHARPLAFLKRHLRN